MPPHKKRRNFSSSDPSSEPYSKGARADGGGRRGVAPPPRRDGGDDGDDDDGPARIVPAASSTRGGASARPPAVAAGRGRAAREKNYLLEMTKLNYQLYRTATKILDSGEPIPDDAFYSGIVENYVLQRDRIRSRLLRTHGDIVVFGNGDCGQLGCGEAVAEARRPKRLANLRGVPIDMVASGGLHTLALDKEGRVYSWGCNDEGSLGWMVTEEKEEGALPSLVSGFYPSVYGPNGTTKDMLDDGGRVVPFQRRREAVLTQVAAGETHSVALSAAGDVYVWGAMKDNEGRGFRSLPPPDDDRCPTGNKDMAALEEDDDPEWYRPPRGNQDWPAHCVGVGKKARVVSAGGSFNAALLEDGSLVTWGIGISGELARPVPDLTKKTPNRVVVDEYLKPKPPLWAGPKVKRTVVTMTCGEYHFLVISREGSEEELSVYSSGLNQYGQLGHGDTTNREKLTKVQALEGRDIAKIGARGHFSCFVDRTGRRLYACGRGDYGQLGITLEQPDAGYGEFLPVRVPLVYEPKGAVANPKENCIKEEDVVEEDQPEIVQISCGSSHVLAVARGGDAYSWGFGQSGACGHGESEADTLRPRRIELRARTQYVSGGGQHSTAIVTTDS